MENFNFKGRTLLIAEDNDDNFDYFYLTCKRTGVSVFRAKNGIEAVALCRDHPEIQMVIMDGMMPGMTGFDATKEIKNFRPELPIIMITAYVNPASMHAAISGGVNDFLAKPIGSDELMIILDKWLGKASSN
jgi:CheY-like chemotaxis protein